MREELQTEKKALPLGLGSGKTKLVRTGTGCLKVSGTMDYATIH